jgi:hypothetical protein
MAVAGPMTMVGVPVTLGSAAGLISMLEEEQVALQTTALRSLNKVVDTHWAEVAGSISVIEAMYEDEFFAQRHLAALLASKVRALGRAVHTPRTKLSRRLWTCLCFFLRSCVPKVQDLRGFG